MTVDMPVEGAETKDGVGLTTTKSQAVENQYATVRYSG